MRGPIPPVARTEEGRDPVVREQAALMLGRGAADAALRFCGEPHNLEVLEEVLHLIHGDVTVIIAVYLLEERIQVAIALRVGLHVRRTLDLDSGRHDRTLEFGDDEARVAIGVSVENHLLCR